MEVKLFFRSYCIWFQEWKSEFVAWIILILCADMLFIWNENVWTWIEFFGVSSRLANVPVLWLCRQCMVTLIGAALSYFATNHETRREDTCFVDNFQHIFVKCEIIFRMTAIAYIVEINCKIFDVFRIHDVNHKSIDNSLDTNLFLLEGRLLSLLRWQ